MEQKCTTSWSKGYSRVHALADYWVSGHEIMSYKWLSSDTRSRIFCIRGQKKPPRQPWLFVWLRINKLNLALVASARNGNINNSDQHQLSSFSSLSFSFCLILSSISLFCAPTISFASPCLFVRVLCSRSFARSHVHTFNNNWINLQLRNSNKTDI